MSFFGGQQQQPTSLFGGQQ
jgi:WD40 repeat protein